MKYLGLGLAVLAVMVTLMIWANRPELLTKPQEHIQAATNKVQDWNDDRRRKAAFAAWMEKLQLPADCSTTESNLRKLECKNQVDLHVARFIRQWSASSRN